MMIKKGILILGCLCVILLVGCGKQTEKESKNEKQKAVKDSETNSEVETSDSLQLTISGKRIEDGRNFSENLAWVKIDGIWSCINTNGNIVFSLNKGDRPHTDFSGGVALIIAADSEGRRSFEVNTVINATGEAVSSLSKDGYDSYLASANGWTFYTKRVENWEKSETLYGAFDKNGEVVVEPSSDRMGERYAGDNIFAASRSDEELNIDYKAYLDMDTNTNFDFRHSIDESFGSGYFVTFNEGNAIYEPQKAYKVNSKGEAIQLPENTGLVHKGKYSENLVFLKGKEMTQGFYDTDLNLKIDLSQYNLCFSKYGTHLIPYFEKDRALLHLENEDEDQFLTIIDKNGKFLFEPVQTEIVGELSEGLFWFKDIEEETITLMNDNGDIIKEFPKEEIDIYDSSANSDEIRDLNERISFFSCGYSLVVNEQSPTSEIDYLFIDTNGDVAFKEKTK